MTAIGCYANNQTFSHDASFLTSFNSEETLFTPVSQEKGTVLFTPTGCNELEFRIHSVQRQMQLQMSIGYVLGKCVRFFVDRITAPVISLRECFPLQQRDLQVAANKFSAHCTQNRTASSTR